MIALKCKSCNGKLEVNGGVSISGGVVTIKSNIRCPYCDTEYIVGDELKMVNNKNINITGNTTIGVVGDNITIKGCFHFGK